MSPLAYTIFRKIICAKEVSKIDRDEIFKLIIAERKRQDELHPLKIKTVEEGGDLQAIYNMLKHNEFFAILAEEFGEVGSALQGEGDLKEEIIQVAAVCVRWLEHIQ